MTDDSGAFDRSFAERRGRRKSVDAGLLSAVLHVVPVGSTLVDLGAGTGELVRALQQSGRPAFGVDGTPGIGELTGGVVVEGNLADAFGRTWAPQQWATCIEVGEHIPAEYESTVLDNIASSGIEGAIVSWAVPGQRGRSHVNCRPPEWVACELGHRGLKLDCQLTAEARAYAGDGWNKKLLVFKRRFARC